MRFLLFIYTLPGTPAWCFVVLQRKPSHQLQVIVFPVKKEQMGKWQDSIWELTLLIGNGEREKSGMHSTLLHWHHDTREYLMLAGRWAWGRSCNWIQKLFLKQLGKRYLCRISTGSLLVLSHQTCWNHIRSGLCQAKKWTAISYIAWDFSVLFYHPSPKLLNTGHGPHSNPLTALNKALQQWYHKVPQILPS